MVERHLKQLDTTINSTGKRHRQDATKYDSILAKQMPHLRDTLDWSYIAREDLSIIRSWWMCKKYYSKRSKTEDLRWRKKPITGATICTYIYVLQQKIVCRGSFSCCEIALAYKLHIIIHILCPQRPELIHGNIKPRFHVSIKMHDGSIIYLLHAYTWIIP